MIRSILLALLSGLALFRLGQLWQWQKYRREKNKLPVGVSVMLRGVFGGHSMILMGARKGGTAAGLLSTPGGRVEKDEPVRQTAHRELLEETGIDIPPNAFQIIGAQEHFRYGGHYVMFYVTAAMPDGVDPVNTEPHKCEGWSWHEIIPVWTAKQSTEPESVLQAFTQFWRLHDTHDAGD